MRILVGWHHVSKGGPCGICGKCDWCALTNDGTLAACRRVELGAWKTKIARGGCPVYLHRLTDGPRQVAPVLPAPSRHPQRARPDVLHTVYGDLLASLNLSRQHRDALRRRGLSDEE